MKFRHHAVVSAALMVLSGTPQALTFNITFAPTTTAQAMQGFRQAADVWSGLLNDDITVNLKFETANIGATLAQAVSSHQSYNYATFRNALSLDTSSAIDVQAVGSLPNGPSFGMLVNRTTDNPNGVNSATPWLDTTGANTRIMFITTANAKALGLAVSARTDSTIQFSSASTYDFDRSNGIDAGAHDFVGIALHEIGHALGFISGVEVLVNYPGGFSSDVYVSVNSLDLFRYSALSSTRSAFGRPGVLDFSADDRAKYFSLDNGVTAGASFSTGANTLFGDGGQTHHWKDGLGLGGLDPNLDTGELLVITRNDLMAFDAIGWNLTNAVPEPGTWALFGLGLAAIGSLRRRTTPKA